MVQHHIERSFWLKEVDESFLTLKKAAALLFYRGWSFMDVEKIHFEASQTFMFLINFGSRCFLNINIRRRRTVVRSSGTWARPRCKSGRWSWRRPPPTIRETALAPCPTRTAPSRSLSNSSSKVLRLSRPAFLLLLCTRSDEALVGGEGHSHYWLPYKCF